MKRNLLLILVILLSGQIYGQTTMENFSYGTITGTSADTLTNPAFGGNPALGNAKWRRHSGTGGPLIYMNASLSYPGYVSSGIGGAVGFTNASVSREDANRSVAPISSGSAYISFLAKITTTGSTGDYFFHVLDTGAITAFRARLFVKDGSVANTYNLGISKGTTTVSYSTTNYKKDSTILVVLKYSFNTSVNDTVYAYVFTGAIPATEPATAQMVSTDISQGDLAVLNAVAIRQGTIGTVSGVIDGIRVSNSWANGPLPVKFADFNAQIMEDQTTKISWSTLQEINNAGFEVEKSKNGIHFEKIGFVQGMGNFNVRRDYAYHLDTDESAFYRLKQIDFDGKFEYSNVVSVQKAAIEMNLLPNPFQSNLEISSNAAITKAEILDLTGKVILSKEFNGQAAFMQTNELLNGIYFIKIYYGDTFTTKRIIKTN